MTSYQLYIKMIDDWRTLVDILKIKVYGRTNFRINLKVIDK